VIAATTMTTRNPSTTFMRAVLVGRPGSFHALASTLRLDLATEHALLICGDAVPIKSTIAGGCHCHVAESRCAMQKFE
jgi:hypothetical protein